MRTIVVAVLLGIGAAVSSSAAVGILRLPDVYLRVQASAKMVVAGAVPVLIAVVVAKGIDTPYASRALIVAVLLTVMNPIASHALTRASYKAGVPMWRGAVVDEPAQRRAPRAGEERTHHGVRTGGADENAGSDAGGDDTNVGHDGNASGTGDSNGAGGGHDTTRGG